MCAHMLWHARALKGGAPPEIRHLAKRGDEGKGKKKCVRVSLTFCIALTVRYLSLAHLSLPTWGVAAHITSRCYE